MKKRLISLLCVTAMAVGLIGCGGGEKEETKAPGSEAQTEAAKAEEKPTETQAQEETRAGD